MKHFYFCIVLLVGKFSVILSQNEDIRMLRFHIFSKENNFKKQCRLCLFVTNLAKPRRMRRR